MAEQLALYSGPKGRLGEPPEKPDTVRHMIEVSCLRINFGSQRLKQPVLYKQGFGATTWSGPVQGSATSSLLEGRSNANKRVSPKLLFVEGVLP